MNAAAVTSVKREVTKKLYSEFLRESDVSVYHEGKNAFAAGVQAGAEVYAMEARHQAQTPEEKAFAERLFNYFLGSK